MSYICPMCFGTGKLKHKCTACDGTGVDEWYSELSNMPCSKCDGLGYVGDELCITCDGTGYVDDIEDLRY